MSENWIPIALCNPGGLTGFLLAYVILFYQYAWFLLSGLSYVYRRLWIYFLVLYGYIEALFFWWTLSHEFQEPRPACMLIENPLFSEKRQRGMPSIEVLLAFTLSTFIMANALATGEYPPRYTLFTIIALPLFVAAAMWITHNNTVAQIGYGALFGFINALRLAGLYHVFLKKPLLRLAQTRLVKTFMPAGAPAE